MKNMVLLIIYENSNLVIHITKILQKNLLRLSGKPDIAGALEKLT